jgi:hypothetical protein
MLKTISILLLAVAMAVTIAACGGGGKDYNIGPIFPLSPNKCAQYDGTQSGSGATESCMVTQSECEKAAAAWQKAMDASGQQDSAIEFSCNSVGDGN